jgi:hypothetical protein
VSKWSSAKYLGEPVLICFVGAFLVQPNRIHETCGRAGQRGAVQALGGRRELAVAAAVTN